MTAIENLFYQFVNKLTGLVKVSCENVFVDGTMIESYANKYSLVWAKAVKKNAAKSDENCRNSQMSA